MRTPVSRAITSRPNANRGIQENVLALLREARVKRELLAQQMPRRKRRQNRPQRHGNSICRDETGSYRNVTRPYTPKHRVNYQPWLRITGLHCLDGVNDQGRRYAGKNFVR